MYLDLERQFQLSGAPQTLAQDFFLDLQLVLVAGVLVVTSAAATEVLAARRNAVRRRLHNRFNRRSREAGLLFRESSLNFFAGQNKGNEHGLAASAGFACARIGRHTGQAVAAVDELFNCEEQDLILRHAGG